LTSQILQEDLIVIILDATPMEYMVVLTAEQRIKGTNLMMADLEEAMNQHWWQISRVMEPGSGEEIFIVHLHGCVFQVWRGGTQSK
jgi:hypothetical protein